MSRIPRPDVSSPTSYYGQPLYLEDDFRLVQVQPGRGDDGIVAHLFNTRLRESPTYEALSYTWGDTSSRKPIQLSNRGDEILGYMLITENCYSALNRLRKVDSPRTLWIDSICIDQGADVERNHQLDLISQIYRQASRVVVFLGESADNSDEAMDWIRENHEPSDFGAEPLPGPNNLQVQNLRPNLTPIEAQFERPWHKINPKLDRDRGDKGGGVTSLSPDLAAIQALLQRPWFTRVWVLQEIAFSSNAVVCCGDREVSWDSFKTFKHWNVGAKGVRRLPYVVDSAPDKSLSEIFASSGKKLLKKLSVTRHCQATDPRDKLFAILPLLDVDNSRLSKQFTRIQPEDDQGGSGEEDGKALCETIEQAEGELRREIVDYRLTPSQVFTKLAIHLLQALGLEVLRDVVGPPSISGLPSWVPDWSVVSQYPYGRYFRTPILGDQQFYYAGFESKPAYNPHEEFLRDMSAPWRASKVVSESVSNFYRLHTPGVKVGIIKTLGPKCDVDMNYFPLREWALLTDEKHRTRSTDKEGLSEFANLLVLGNFRYKDAVLHALRRIKKYNEVDRTEENSGAAHDGPQGPDTKLPLRDVMKSLVPSFRIQGHIIFEACDGRRLFVSDTGYIGLAPDFAQVGDSVFVLESASVPFIFRENTELHTDDVPAMSLVGECHIQGVMKGEAWAGAPKVEELVIV